jgi:hypothetical protein
MPFRPGTGIPYGKSTFAFSIAAAETPRTVPVNSSSLGDCDGCATADGVAAAAGAAREVGRRVACGVFVG